MEQRQYQQQRNAFATASVIFCIMAVFSGLIFYAAIFFGCLSILFALLSRQAALQMPNPSKVSSVISALTMIMSVAITVFAFMYLVQLFGWDTVLDPNKLLQECLNYINSTGGGTGL